MAHSNLDDFLNALSVDELQYVCEIGPRMLAARSPRPRLMGIHDIFSVVSVLQKVVDSLPPNTAFRLPHSCPKLRNRFTETKPEIDDVSLGCSEDVATCHAATDIERCFKIRGVNIVMSMRTLALLSQLGSLKKLTLGGSSALCSLESVALPQGLLGLMLGGKFNQSLENVKLPDNLETLGFGREFNQLMDHVKLPARLKELAFGNNFNQSLIDVSLPSGLVRLTFGGSFNQNMGHVIIPSSLRELQFGNKFNQALGVLPSGLRKLQFGRDFNQALGSTVFPAGLKALHLGQSCSLALEEALHFGARGGFDQSLSGVVFPSSLRVLVLGGKFNQPLDDVKLPSDLEALVIGPSFQQHMDLVTLPSRLRCLELSVEFKHMDTLAFPSGLRMLNLRIETMAGVRTYLESTEMRFDSAKLPHDLRIEMRGFGELVRLRVARSGKLRLHASH